MKPRTRAFQTCLVLVEKTEAFGHSGSSKQMEQRLSYRSKPVLVSKSMPTLVLQRAAIAPATVHDVPPIVHEVLRSSGQPLDPTTRAIMEPRFGYDFSQVRVHADGRAAESARAVRALAYTVGQDVVLGMEQHSPKSSKGKQLLAHELVHVVQQRSNKALGGKITVDSPDGRYEREAQRLSAHILRGQPLERVDAILSRGLLALQRDNGDEEPVCREPSLEFLECVPPTNEHGLGQPTGRATVNPEIAHLPWSRNVDNFESAVYDLSYRSERGNLSRWLRVMYSDGTEVDINIFSDLVGETLLPETVRDAIARGYVGDGGRVFPERLNSQTVPRLWAARQSALDVMDEYNVQFIRMTMPVVTFIITMPLVTVGSGPPRATRRPISRGSVPRLTEGSSLIGQLRRAGISFSEADIVFITRTPTGRIVWLETGTTSAGMRHILIRHGNDFARIGLRGEAEIQNTLLRLTRTQSPVRISGGGVHVYRLAIGGTQRGIRIVIGDNGFIVTAHPAPL